MLSRQVLLAILAALSVSAVPLNINLGAYSPALVVGDGEISFGGNPERASELLQTLASGASNGAVGNGQMAPRPIAASPEGQRQPLTMINPPPAMAPPAAAAAPGGEGITSPLVTPTLSEQASQKPDTNTAAPAIAVEGNMGSSMPAEYISHAISGSKYPNMAKTKRSVVIGERDAQPDPRVEAAKQKIKRDIDGFREALAFARDAQRNSPKVELGFGIIQSPGINVPQNSASNGGLPAGGIAGRAKRDLSDTPAEKLGMTLIAISEI